MTPSLTLRVTLAGFAAQYQAPGPVRDDDVQAARITFLGSYPINNDLGGWQRGLLTAAAIDWRGPLARAELRVFGIVQDSALTEDFTGLRVPLELRAIGTTSRMRAARSD